MPQPLQANRHGVTVWFTGLPCSGKSTLARLLHARLVALGYPVQVLDGDEVRQWLTRGLGYSREDRDENIRRIARVAKLLTDVGAVAIVAAISPYQAIREEARKAIGHFIEVYVKCPLDACIQRDSKGMYHRALSGELPHFTGVSDPYEEPAHPELMVETDRRSVEECVTAILHVMDERGDINMNRAMSAPISVR